MKALCDSILMDFDTDEEKRILFGETYKPKKT